jgi:predicted TIM-barrel fold metal-dependent hydrolase
MIARRTLLQGAATAALAATTTAISFRPVSAQPVPYSAGTEPPKLKAPPNACDCHMHIYNSRFPAAPDAALRPGDAHAEDYRLFQKRIGTSRNVIVTPSTYGTDNSCTLDALATLGASARAIAVVDTSVTDAELKRLSGLGVRGMRFMLNPSSPTTVAMLEPLSKRVADLGWHVQISTTAKQIIAIEDVLMRSPIPVVFDHFGHPGQPAGINDPVFGTVRRLIDKGRTFVKLSAPYIDSKVGAPTYADVTPVAQAYVKAAPERMLWASDWPHPSQGDKHPDDAVLFDLLAEWIPDAATRNRILVQNPEAFYGFGKPA